MFLFVFSLFGGFATGDNEGYVIIWDGRSKKRLLEVFSVLLSYDLVNKQYGYYF